MPERPAGTVEDRAQEQGPGFVMRAVTRPEYGGPEVLHVAEVPEPHAGPGQVRVAVRAAGVNPLDWKMRSGMLGQDGPLPVAESEERAAEGVRR